MFEVPWCWLWVKRLIVMFSLLITLNRKIKDNYLLNKFLSPSSFNILQSWCVFFQSYTSNFSSKYWCDVIMLTPFKLEICGCLAKAHCCFLLYLENKSLESKGEQSIQPALYHEVWVKRARESRFLIQFHQEIEGTFFPEHWQLWIPLKSEECPPAFSQTKHPTQFYLQLAIFHPNHSLLFFPNFSKN